MDNTPLHAQSEAINTIVNSIRASVESFNSMIEGFHTPFKLLHEILQTAERYSVIMLELGWPPDGELLIFEMKDILEEYDKYGPDAIRKKVDSYMLQRFDIPVIKATLHYWTDQAWLAKRFPILQEAVQCHIAEQYYAAVSTILPQIEGIIVDYFRHFGRLNGNKLEEYAKQLFDCDEKNLLIDLQFRNFYLINVLANFEHGKPINSFLSRHAILHGADTDYGTAANSLKAILFIDRLIQRISLQEQATRKP